MNDKSKALPAAIVGVLVAAAIIGGIAILSQQGALPGSSSTNGIFGQSGTLAAQITDPPNVPAGVTGVYVTYSVIEVHMQGSGSSQGWYTVADSGTLDLMSVVNISETLGSNHVPAGTYDLVRFDITNANVTYDGKNYTASVPSNQITIPINGDGINVSAGGNVGFLIDVSPTVVPYQNGASLGFVLVPAATSFPIPSLSWQHSEDEKGARADVSSQSWYQESQDHLRGNITVVSASLSNSSFSITVENTGKTNVSLTALSILSNGSSGTVNPSDSGESSSTTTATTSPSTYSHAEAVASDTPHPDLNSELQTIASFQILSNGTVVQHNQELEDGNYFGFLLQPGQIATLSFSGAIATLPVDVSGDVSSNIALTSSSSAIIGGQNYVIAVLGQFDTRAYENVAATTG